MHETEIAAVVDAAHRAIRHGDVPWPVRTARASRRAGRGLCSHFALILCEDLWARGQPARAVALFSDALADAHVLVEARVGDRWYVLDAMMGAMVADRTVADLLRAGQHEEPPVRTPEAAPTDHWGWRYYSPEFLQAVNRTRLLGAGWAFQSVHRSLPEALEATRPIAPRRPTLLPLRGLDLLLLPVIAIEARRRPALAAQPALSGRFLGGVAALLRRVGLAMPASRPEAPAAITPRE